MIKKQRKKDVNLDEFVDPYFYSLINRRVSKVKRRCLRCQKEFISAHTGNRCCGACVVKNSRESAKMQSFY